MTLKQVFIVNSDLGMGKGKIVVQCCHGEVLYLNDIMEEYTKKEGSKLWSNYISWRGLSTEQTPIGTMTKIVLKSDEVTMRNIASLLPLKGINCYEVYDLGLTQVDKGSFTCLCVEPLEEEVADKLFGHLKLL